MSNRWIHKSIHASPIWLLHHKSTYLSLYTRIGATGFEPGHVVYLVFTNCDLQRIAIYGDASWWPGEYNWRLRHWRSREVFYCTIHCEAQLVELQATVGGDGAALGAKVSLWYSHEAGWVARGTSGAGCNRNGEIDTSGCTQILGNTTWYWAIDVSARHGAMGAGVEHADHRHANTLGDTGDRIQV